MRLWKRRCPPHDWFPNMEPREFIPVENICLRCREREVLLPWGQCLGDHPIAEHYSSDGHIVPLNCRGPA